jgi:hypothetical protein
MEINRNNYEAYFIDYLEGNLDEKFVDSFIEFIKLNPDLKEELTLFESVSAMPETISFNKKDSLYKEKYDSEKEFNDTAIALLEGDISDLEKLEFEVYLAKHPEKKKDAATFAHTKLKADESIVFRKKNTLYRKTLGKTILFWSTRVAAILILAFAIFGLYRQTSTETIPVNHLAEVENKTSEKDIEVVVSALQEKTEVTLQEKMDEAKPDEKEVIPEKKSQESIRETTEPKLKKEEVAALRIPLEIPTEMQVLTASFNVKPPKVHLATMYLSYPENYFGDEQLLADKVKEKVNLNKIAKAGLKLVTTISNEKFTYQTNNAGEVTAYNYDSRLLAFSFHNNKTQAE